MALAIASCRRCGKSPEKDPELPPRDGQHMGLEEAVQLGAGVRGVFSCSLANMGLFGQALCSEKGFLSSTLKLAQAQKENFVLMLPHYIAPHEISFLLMEKVLVPWRVSEMVF